MIKRVPLSIDFFTTGIWYTRLEDVKPIKAFAIRLMRIILMAGRRFIHDRCSSSASVLTYYSLLNVVPLVAVAFAMAKGFGLETLVEERIIQLAADADWQTEMTDQILTFARSLLGQAKGGVIAGTGVILLFWTVISILGKIEDSFNAIWEVKKPRSLARKFTDYMAMMILAPVLFTISSSMTLLVASRIKEVVVEMEILGSFSTVIFFFLKLLPYFTMSILLAAQYMLMPNTRVPVRSAITGGVVAGIVYQVLQWVYIKFQIGVASYGAIYGSFAALPLFLGWLQMSWMVVLFGAEFAAAHHHAETFGFHPDYSAVGTASRKSLVVRVFHLIVRRFCDGEKPMTARQIADTLRVPLRFVQYILSELIETGLVVEVVKGKKNEIAFQPAHSVETVTIKETLDAYERSALSPPASKSGEPGKIDLLLREIAEAMEKSQGNVRLKDI